MSKRIWLLKRHFSVRINFALFWLGMLRVCCLFQRDLATQAPQEQTELARFVGRHGWGFLCYCGSDCFAFAYSVVGPSLAHYIEFPVIFWLSVWTECELWNDECQKDAFLEKPHVKICQCLKPFIFFKCENTFNYCYSL